MSFTAVLIRKLGSMAGLLGKKNHDDAERNSVSGPNSLKMELYSRIEEFMERDLFFLAVQPVVDYRNSEMFHVEILSRLNHPELGTVFPNDFIPVIEARGLYSRFDRYIFRKSCAWLSQSLAEGLRIHCISCNFSRNTLSEENLAEDLIAIADSYGVSHRAIALEITEQVPGDGAIKLQNNLNRLKAADFRIILDDYGSGVTSISDLMRYPLDILKIDRSLLLNAATEQGAAAFKALVEMACKLGVEVVCEGIETEEQSQFARDAGCHYGQGFLYYRPMSTEQVVEMIR